MKLTNLLGAASIGMLALATTSEASATPIMYACVPTQVSADEMTVQVRCAFPSQVRLDPAPSYPKDGTVEVRSFGILLWSNAAWARRLQQLADIAMASGLALVFEYDPGAVTYGCGDANNCRVPKAVYLMPRARVPL